MNNDKQEFQALNGGPKVNDDILAEFDTATKKFYVDIMTNDKDDEADYEVSYLRKKADVIGVSFSASAGHSTASIKFNDIKVTLPKPTTCVTAETKLLL